MSKRAAICAFLLVLTLFFPHASAAMRSGRSQFLWLSDIHFNPFYDPTLVDKLAAAPPSDWTAILNSSSSTKLPSFGQDANWPLLSSAFLAIKRTIPAPAFTIVTGDLMAHHFREQFDATATAHDDHAFGEFARKTVEFIGLQLNQLSPDTRSIVALGNNDSDCGDYFTESDGPFLRSTGPPIAALAGAADNSSFSAPWNGFGSFSVRHPVLRKHRIVVLDTTFLSSRHRNGCAAASVDAGSAMLTWLTHELADARQHGDKVWLVYHIPPGVDGFATIRSGASSANASVTFWKDSYSTTFEELSKQYRSTVEASFAGHTHMDDFRLINQDDGPPSVVMLTPALGPNVRQNPSFRIVTLSSRGKLQDQATYYLANLAKVSQQVPADWKLEYSFKQAWNLRGLNAGNYEKLWRRTAASSRDRGRWTLFYSASAPGPFIPPDTFGTYHCASGYTNAREFADCVGKEQPN
ncbi:MAG: metallophosphoesterase [Acidobacteriota bacterium]|nr:metallophosphoesterase [Acidobacteriota bacterium]